MAYSDSTLYEPDARSGTSSTALTLVSGFLFLALLGALIFAYFQLRRRRILATQAQAFEKQAIQVILPKPSPEEERKDPKELIGVMEPFLSSLSHFFETDKKKTFLQGQPTFSLEITSKNGEIGFFVVSPKIYIEQIERQIHASYPSAHLERVTNHDIFLQEGGESAVGGLKLQKEPIFPIRTYRNLENDPLNAISNSLSKVQQGSASIQILIQPTEQNLSKKTETALQNIQQGKSFQKGTDLPQQALSLAREVSEVIRIAPYTDNEAQNKSNGGVRLTALQEQQAKLLVDKGSKIQFQVQIRCVARAQTQAEAKNYVQTMLSAFAQFNAPESNSFRIHGLDERKLLISYILRAFSPLQHTLFLNTEELCSLYHFPNKLLETPTVTWLGARKLPPPANLPKSGTILGFSQFRGANLPIYIQDIDRARHLYMIGKTGVGKTTLFQNMILQDIRNGHGVCYMDPNGDAVQWILRHIPKERAEDVILFDPSDVARPMALNLMEYDPAYPEQKTMVVNEILSIFDKLYDLKQTGGPMFEQYMRNAMLLVMDDPETGNTLMEIPKVLADAEFRKKKLQKNTNQVVIDFWTKEAEKAGGEAALANMVPYITSKLTQFTTNDIMRPIIAQQKSAFHFRDIMDEKKILLVTLPKGLLGDMNARLLGMIISGKIQIAAFSRQNIPEEERVPFYLYVDEFQNFTSKTFATILSEARKYKLALNITNQYIEQLDDETRSAVIGNVGTLLAWRVGASDAEVLKKELEPLQIDDLVNTEKFNFYLRMLIDGSPSQPFNATAYGPDPHENIQIGEAIRQLSRLTYGKDREVVESEIRLRSQSVI